MDRTAAVVLAALLLLPVIVDADCHSNLIYTYTATGTQNLTLVDLTNMAAYVNPSLTNVNVTGRTSWYFQDYKLNVPTSAGLETFTVNIYDDTVSQAKVTNSTIAQETKTPTASAFTRIAYAYNLSLKDEDTGGVWVNTTTTQLKLEGVCSSYSTYTIDNLKTLTMSGYKLGFYEPPLIRILTDNSITREQKQSASNMNLQFYLLNMTNATTQTSVRVDYRLNDYTGQYLTSTLETARAYNDVWKIIDDRQWTSENENNGFYFRPNVYYRIRVKGNLTTEDKGQFKYDTNGTQTIKTTTPIINYNTNTLTGLPIWDLYQNITQQKIYCQHAVDAAYSFYGSTFTVYNWSDLAHPVLYTASNTSTSAMTYSYQVYSTSDSYKAVCVLNYSLGTPTKTQVFNFQAYSNMFMAPSIVGNSTQQHDALGGFTVTELFQYGSVFLLLFIIGLGSKAVASYILLFFAGVLWLLNKWMWMSVHPLLIGFVIVFAVVFRFVKAKEDKQ